MNLALVDNLKLTSVLLLTIVLGACGGSSNDPVPGIDVPSSTGNATLMWLPPTTNEDGSALEDLAGYKLYYGTSSDKLNNVIKIDNPGLSTYVIDGLSENVTYYFAIKAIDFAGNESIFSNITSKYIQG